MPTGPLYVADSDFVDVPVAGLLDDDYLEERSMLITDMDMGQASPGVPPGVTASLGADNRAKSTGTSHISIVDRFWQRPCR